VTASTAAVPIRPAATLVLLRDGADGLEVFMVQRAARAVFLGGAYVFPGGALDTADADPAMQALIAGIDAREADERLGLREGALAYWIAALRECFEEAGFLLAHDRSGEPLHESRAAALAQHRQALNAQRMPFADVLRTENVLLAGSQIAYYQHWITAPLRPRRFDTRFFIALAPRGQAGLHDNTETVHSLWTRPADALARGKRGEIELAFATQYVLRDLARFDTADAALAYARALRDIPCHRGCIAQGREGQKLFRRGDAPYHEIHWTDPAETTASTYDMNPGEPKMLDAWVTRIIAPNPGMMTGPGTNTYLVGRDDVAVIDPGPLVDSHVDAILAHGAGRIRWILCTHSHRDHSPAAAVLKARTGAQVIGCRPLRAGRHDETFMPDVLPADGQRIELAGCTLRAMHTPGHASNHVCYLLEPTRMLFTGDHVMQGSTVVIDPPDGDMRAYLASLEMLLGIDLAILAPGHGYLIGEPHREVRRLIAHRLAREAKVLAAVRKLGSATLDALVPLVYDDVDPRRHAVAARSLEAHLEKLLAEGRVVRPGPQYTSTLQGAEVAS
jgi:glyoxylase-like metal-dependent hydrolase (beta-lactamase superfamily II)/8-oxo-dGTP pyrophosphatase MutT (NUDIX family)